MSTECLQYQKVMKKFIAINLQIYMKLITFQANMLAKLPKKQ